MTSAERVRANVPAWDIAVPARPSRLPGVTMAGFSDRATDLSDVALVPHPAVTLIFDLGEEPLVVVDETGRQLRNRIVAGLASGGTRGQGQGRSFECLQVRLSPVVAHAALGGSSQLGGTVVGLDDLWGRDAERTQERLRATGTWEERFAIAETVLAARYATGRPVDPEVAVTWKRLVASRGRVRVERLAAEVGWSRKRLWSRFGSQLGLTPKRAALLIRFDRAAHRLAAGQSPATVAADGGYVDQSHLHRDVVAFTGVTPAVVAVAPFLAVDDVAWAAPHVSGR